MTDELLEDGPRALCTVQPLEPEPDPSAVKFREVMEAAGYEVNPDDCDYPQVIESAVGLDEILKIAADNGLTVSVYGDMPDQGMIDTAEKYGFSWCHAN